MKKLLGFVLLLSGQPLVCLTDAVVQSLSDRLIVIVADRVLDREAVVARIEATIIEINAAVGAEAAASPVGGSLGEPARTSGIRKVVVDRILERLKTWEEGPGRALIPAHGAGLVRETAVEQRLRKIRFDLTHGRA